mmetsp:Transcript_35287/g.77627  ORF Transcript_35287/g.77627 Transcript_35287/m.77627 type:complete len:248 (-) Transcript_35287:286-1029(-)
MSTFIPSARIVSAAPPANLITSPCVSLATVGMFLPTRGSLRVVLATSETSSSWPLPEMRMSNLPLNLPKCKHLTSSARSSGVRASGPKGVPFASQWLTASSVSERKTLPFDQLTARGNTDSSLLTVVPLPVPLRPCSTSTQPSLTASPSFSTISAATMSADLPATSILQTGSTGGSASTTPFAIASRMPAASFSPSSASRAMMPSISFCEKLANSGSDSNAAMMAFEVESSPFSNSDLLSGSNLGCA